MPTYLTRIIPGVALWLVFLLAPQHADAQLVFSDFQSVIRYLETESPAAKNGKLELSQSEKSRLIAIYGVIDPNISGSASYTDNTRLPVNLLPAEIFGGPEGAFQEVQFGIRYNTNLNGYGEIKLVNPQGIRQLQLSRLSINLTAESNQYNLKELSESVCSVYYNIIQLQEQRRATETYMALADSLLKLAENKHAQGLIRTSELSELKIQLADVREEFRQLDFELRNQYAGFMILCGIPQETAVTVEYGKTGSLTAEVAGDVAAVRKSAGEAEIASANLKLARSAFYPTLSLFASATTQQYNQQARLYNADGNWINSSYLGLKLSVSLPGSTQLTNMSKARYDLQIASNNLAVAKAEAELTRRQRETAIDASASAMSNSQTVAAMREEIFAEEGRRYMEGLVSATDFIATFKRLRESRFNAVRDEINWEKSKVLLFIFNTF